MGVELVTAYRGVDGEGNPLRHVSSMDDARRVAGTVGLGSYVLATGQRLAATMEDANTLVVASGDGLINGHHFTVDGTASFTIPTGVQGMQVSNLACIRYSKDGDGIESAVPVVLTGEPAAESPQDPAYNDGSILDGDSTVDFPLYRVVTTGISAGEPEQLYEVVEPVSAAPRIVKAGDFNEGRSHYRLWSDRTIEYWGMTAQAQLNASAYTTMNSGVLPIAVASLQCNMATLASSSGINTTNSQEPYVRTSTSVSSSGCITFYFTNASTKRYSVGAGWYARGTVAEKDYQAATAS